MSLSIGIVGLPNVGKSTLFNALTDNNVLAANYPFATIEPNVGIVPVPDERLGVLTRAFKPAKTIPATVTFTDIAGLVAGAHKGEGLGNQFLANIRETAAIAQVVRVFHDDNVAHVGNEIKPLKDIETVNTELVLADLQTVTKRLDDLEGKAKADPKLRPLIADITKVQKALDEGKLASSVILSDSEESRSFGFAQDDIRGLHLLTAKPFIYVFNVDELTLADSETKQELAGLVSPAPAVFICAKLEAELAGLTPAEASELLQSLGQNEPGLNQLIKTGYETLGLQSFFTAGEKEVRAWTIPKGASAPEAAGVIHTDFQRGFIAAEVTAYEDLAAAGSKAAAKAAGKLRTEGKDYIMREGDVVEFRFNV